MIHRLRVDVGRCWWWGEKKVAYTLSNSARGKMTPQWRLSLKKKGGKISGAGRKHSRRNGFGRKKIFRGSRKKLVWVSKLWASYTATRTRRCFRRRNAPGANWRVAVWGDWTLIGTKHTRIRSFCRSCRTGDTPVNRNYGTIARKWLNVFFLRSVPLESFGTCVKAAAPQRPSESIQPVLEKKKRSIANNKSALTWNTQWHKVSFYAPFPSDLGPGLLLLLHQWEMQ